MENVRIKEKFIETTNQMKVIHQKLIAVQEMMVQGQKARATTMTPEITGPGQADDQAVPDPE